MGIFGKKRKMTQDEVLSLLKTLMDEKVMQLPDTFVDGSPLDRELLLRNAHIVLEFMYSDKGRAEATRCDGHTLLGLLLTLHKPDSYKVEFTTVMAGNMQLNITASVFCLRNAMTSVGEGAAERALSGVALSQMKAMEASGRQEEIISMMVQIAKESD